MAARELTCPECGAHFALDDAGHAALLAQVRSKEFEQEVLRAEEQARKQAEAGLQAHIMKLDADRAQELSEKDREIQGLRAKLSMKDAQAQAALERRLSEEQALRAEVEKKLERARAESESAVLRAVDRERAERMESEQGYLAQKEKLSMEMESMRASYEERLAAKDEQVAYYRDFKARQSTKMVGESLERHCEQEFERLRPIGFQDVYFEKDNDASAGSKGDYIYRESAPDGTELLSIMFEMKTESEATAAKHKNADFFAKLDRDRKAKGCEYAVLVTLLEMDSDLYNGGIVDVSYKYPKMYVVRPQCFIPIITVLRNAAVASLEARQELARIRETDVDVSRFEGKLADFKTKFSKNYDAASKKFQAAIDEIDRSIQHLQKTKDALLASDRQLQLAGSKADALTVDRLVRGNPTMKAAFAALERGAQ